MIRKSALFIIPIFILVSALIIWLVDDLLIENIAEYALELTFNTEVELEGLDIDILNMSVQFEKLRIQDPNDTQTNWIHAGPAILDIMGMQLFAKKFVVPNMKLQNITLNTKVQKGDISDYKKSDSNLVEKIEKNAPQIDFSVLTKKLDLEAYTDSKNLKTIIQMNQAQKDAEEKLSYWENQLENNTFEQDIKNIQTDFQKIQVNKLQSVQDLQKAITTLQRLQKNISKTSREVSNLHNKATNDLKDIDQSFTFISKSMDEDIEAAKRLAKIKDVNTSDIGEMLFGKNSVEKFYEIMGYLDTVGAFFERDEVAPPPRRIGRNIVFPVYTVVYPDLFVNSMQISGILLNDQDKKNIKWSGHIQGLASDQRVLNKPTYLNIQADRLDSETRYLIKGTFDYREKESVNTLVISGEKIELVNIELGQESNTWPKQIYSKNSDLSMTLQMKGENLKGEILMNANNVIFSFSSKKANGELERAIRKIFSNIRRVEVRSTLSGTLSNLNYKVTSNIDEILSNRINRLVGQKIKEAEEKIRNKIQAQVDTKKKEIEKNVYSKKATLEKEINKQLAQIEQYKKETQAKIDKAKKKMQKEGEDQLKKKLLDLF